MTNYNALVTKLQSHLVALGDGRDTRSENERVAYRTTYDPTQACISGLKNAPRDLDASACDSPTSRHAVLPPWRRRTKITKAIAAAPDWWTVRDGRERDREYARQQHLRRQLHLLHEGTLLRAPGVAYERLADLDARITELKQRVFAAQSALDAHVRAAEALLAERREPVATVKH